MSTCERWAAERSFRYIFIVVDVYFLFFIFYGVVNVLLFVVLLIFILLFVFVFVFVYVIFALRNIVSSASSFVEMIFCFNVVFCLFVCIIFD